MGSLGKSLDVVHSQLTRMDKNIEARITPCFPVRCAPLYNLDRDDTLLRVLGLYIQDEPVREQQLFTC